MISRSADRHHGAPSRTRRARAPRARRFAWGPAIVAAVALVAIRPADAHAYEDRVTLELGSGFALAPNGGTLRYGPPVTVESLVGLSPGWSLGVRASYLPLFPRPTTHLGILGLEACYQLDVVHVVPRISFGAAGLLGGTSGAGPWGGFALTARLGVDWLHDAFLVGLDVRGSVLPLSNAAGVGHGFVELGIRVGVVIDRY